MSDSASPIAIVGIGCLFPKAGDRAAFWANIQGGVDAIRDVPESHWRTSDYLDRDPKAPDMVYTARGGFLDPVDFDTLYYGISPNNLEATDTSQLLGLVATRQALEDAGYGDGGRPFNRRRTSVILGVTGTLELVVPLGARLGHPRWRKALAEAGVEQDVAEDVIRRIGDAYVPWQENSFPGLLGNVVAGRIANRFDFGGTNCVVDAACASSLGAVHLAMLELQAGRSDMVATGGIDTFNDIFMYMCFSKTPALSPTGDAKPFDVKADGTILGEGLGVLLLKRLADAERDGDRIYAVIKGMGSSSDGKGSAVYAPSSKGQIEALTNAHRSAGVTPDTIELVEAHGTGTKVGDAVEVSALADVFGATDRAGPWCALGSVKSQIGHTKAAAGSAGLIKAALALHHKVLPPTIKVTQPGENLNEARPFYVNVEPRPWMASTEHPRRAGVSSFGFGGSNFHCILEEYGVEKSAVDWDADVQILALSADSDSELKSKLAAFPKTTDWDAARFHASESRRSFRPEQPYRLTVVMEKGNSGAVAEAAAMLERDAKSAFWETPGGAYFARGDRDGKLAALFPGQGSQYVGMLRDWACRFPEMQAVLAEADLVQAEGESSAFRLSDRIYPPFAFDRANRESQEDELRATQVAQPALGAVSVGAMAVLERLGVEPDAVAGHSYGELVALCAAQRLDRRSLHGLSALRGRLMASESIAGAMIAVHAPIADVENLLAEEKLDLVVANRNSPMQAVLSGSIDAVERADAVFASRRIRSQRLKVSAAFHSPMVAAAREPFAKALATVAFADGRLPVYANTTAKEYPREPAAARALLAGQLANPVDFVSQIRNMYDAGVRTFVEVGPGGKLTGLVKSILADRDFHAIAVDASNGKRRGLGDLARATAALGALGFSRRLQEWDPNPPQPKPAAKSGAVVPIVGANYVKSRPARPPAPKQARPTPAPAATPVAAPAKSSVTAPTSPPPASQMTHAANPNVSALIREGLAAIQKAQEQAARLHSQFLDQQLEAQRSIQSLFAGVTGGVVSAPTPVAPVMPRPSYTAPVPAAVVPSIPTPPPPAPATVFAAPVAKAPARSAPAAQSNSSVIAGALLEVVAEKTGYPLEMLNLDMGMDADLGIDSIKRVEILSALQEKLPNAPHIGPDQLGSLRTLADVVSFLDKDAGGRAAPAHAVAVEVRPIAQPSAATATAPSADVAAALLEVVAEKTGYPIEMLNLDMGMDADLGIDSIKRVEILSALQEKLPNAPHVGSDQLGSLRTLGDVVAYLGVGSPTTVAHPTPVVPMPVAASAAPSGDVSSLLLEVVADKTGYPLEMLNLDMGMDADLGIDSIKRVEILSALQEKLPNAPHVGSEQLGSMRTLADVVQHLAGGAAASAQQTPVSSTATIANAATTHIEAEAEAATGVDAYFPVLVPIPPTSQRKRIEFSEGSVVWIADSGSELGQKLAYALTQRKLKVVVRSYAELLTIGCPGALAGLILLQPERVDPDLCVSAFRLIRQVGPTLRRADKRGALIASVACIDGAFGFASDDVAKTADVLGGGLAGLVKTAAHEWPEVHCKALDIAPLTNVADVAPQVVEELTTAGPVEVAIGGATARTVGLAPLPMQTAEDKPLLDKGDVVVVTGGARGVTASVAVALAAKYKPTLVLWGRGQEPGAEPEWLAGVTDDAEIKRGILRRANNTLSPKEVSERAAAIAANREALSTLARIREAGAQVVYQSVDVTDPSAVAEALVAIRRRIGPIRGVVHGAGVLADKLIEDKDPSSFQTVFATKVAGILGILGQLTKSDSLKLLAFFSSSTARFGRKGQVDYAAANEVLNKLAQQQARLRPQARVLSFDWGPWDGGMVTPALKRVFEAEGIVAIPQAGGARFFVDALEGAPRGVVEIVVLGSGSRVPEVEVPVAVAVQSSAASTPVSDDSDSVFSAPEPPPALESSSGVKIPGSFRWPNAQPVERVVPVGSSTRLWGGDNGASAAATEITDPASAAPTLAFERTLDVASHPILRSHVIDGRAVLPAALMVEWLGHAALHRNPGMMFHGFDDFRVLKGVVLSGTEQRRLRAFVGKATKVDGLFRVSVELRGETPDGREFPHARAQVLLATRMPGPPALSDRAPVTKSQLKTKHLYEEFLFHGKDLRCISRVDGCSTHGIDGAVEFGAAPADWMSQPLRSSWLADPLAIDGAFQLMIVWSREAVGTPSLPTFVKRYRQFRSHFPDGEVRVSARITKRSSHQASADVLFLDRAGEIVAGMYDYECVVDASLKEAFSRNRLR